MKRASRRTAYTLATVFVFYFVIADQARSAVATFRCVTDKFAYACDARGCTKQTQPTLIYLFKVDVTARTGTVQTCETVKSCSNTTSELINVEGTPEGGFRAATLNCAFMGTVVFSITPTTFAEASVIGGYVSADVGRCSLVASITP